MHETRESLPMVPSLIGVWTPLQVSVGPRSDQILESVAWTSANCGVVLHYQPLSAGVPRWSCHIGDHIWKAWVINHIMPRAYGAQCRWHQSDHQSLETIKDEKWGIVVDSIGKDLLLACHVAFRPTPCDPSPSWPHENPIDRPASRRGTSMWLRPCIEHTSVAYLSPLPPWKPFLSACVVAMPYWVQD